ncbi:MAG TPA: hydrogen peroxide-dependent heme synthase [Baekduia sp.]|nr:hydrogen peroxide-dependent heme synthase [Baekduia sp.]
MPDQQPTDVPFTLYATFQAPVHGAVPEAERAAAAEEALAALGSTPAHLRGAYHTSGYRAETDLLLWLVGTAVDDLQDAYTAFRRTALGRWLRPVWSVIGVHREAEFAKSHTPAFFRGEEPRKYVSVYPFVRSYEWYLLPPQERAQMLREHGEMGRLRPEVQANTVSAFALNDYEWLLAFECDEVEPIVDLMRHLRGAEARRHTREEIPFHVGRRRPLGEILAELP